MRRKYGRGINIFMGGDFNSRIGYNQDIWNDVKGNFCNDVQNENGLLFLEFCLRNRLKITNSFFQKKSYGTWIHPRSKKWITLDYILVSQDTFRNVMNCEVKKMFDVFSDHRAVMLNFVVPKQQYKLFKHRVKKLDSSPKLNFKSLVNDFKLCDTIGQWIDLNCENINSFDELVTFLDKCCVQ